MLNYANLATILLLTSKLSTERKFRIMSLGKTFKKQNETTVYSASICFRLTIC